MPKIKEEIVDETVEELSEDQGIKIGSPIDIRPKSLPLVVQLPPDASKAQIEFTKTLNGYAYKNPEKWELKKDSLIKKLLSLKDAPDPVEGNLKVNKTSF